MGGYTTVRGGCLIVLFLSAAVAVAQPPAPGAVRDGRGRDIDYLRTTSTYSVNWDGVDWSGYEDDLKYYDVRLFEAGGSPVAQADVPLNGTTGIPSTSHTFSGLSLIHNSDYYAEVSAVAVPGGQTESSDPTASDGVLVDVEAPTVIEVSPDGGTVDRSTIPVRWEFEDRSGGEEESGLASYDVEVREGGGSPRRLLSGTSRTSFSFAGAFGGRYRFRVSARDRAGNESAFYETDQVSVRELGGAFSLSADPGSLSLARGESEKQVELALTLSGIGSLNLTSIREDRLYPERDLLDEGATESLSGTVVSGATLVRTLEADAVDRSRAGHGDMRVTYRVAGLTPGGERVEASATVEVRFIEGFAEDLTVTDLTVELPPSPYYVGDEVHGRIRIEATGSGTVAGEVLIDGSASWSTDPTFTTTVDGTTVVAIAEVLPTDVAGTRTVEVRLTAPVSRTAAASYTVTDAEGPFPADRLVLIPDVAELSDLRGTAEARSDPSAGYTEYSFTGTATFHVLSLEGAVFPDTPVEDLIVRYTDGGAGGEIRGGTVRAEASGAEPLGEAADGYLRIRNISFEGRSGRPTDALQAAAALYLPRLGTELLIHEGFPVGESGVEGVSFSHDRSDPLVIEDLFGAEFRLHDAAGARAVSLERDEARERYGISLSGSIAMEEKEGTSTSTVELTTFTDLTLYTDGEVDGEIGFAAAYELVADYLYLDGITVRGADTTLEMDLNGYVAGLPDPLGDAGEIPFALTVDSEGSAAGRIAALNELEPEGEGHGLGGDDTEWDLFVATLDLTYVGLGIRVDRGAINLDHSEIAVGFDAYLNLSDETEDEARRVGFGDLNAAGDFEGGLRIGMDGEVTFHAASHISTIEDERIDLAALTIIIDRLDVKPDPFALVFNGGFELGLEAVSGGIHFEGLEVALDGSISGLSDAITGGELDIVDVVKVEVAEVEWSGDLSGAGTHTITFDEGSIAGEGASRTFGHTEDGVTVEAESFFRLSGARVYIGGGESSILQGGFEELTVYEPAGGGRRNFVLQDAELEVNSGAVKLRVDAAFQDSRFMLAGAIDLETISGAGVGVVGSRDGKPSMGVFLAVSGLNLQIGPVTVDELGGGFFVNPAPGDMELVRSVAGFDRPELDDKITENRPAAESNSFAVMVMGGLYVGDESLISGRALVTVAENFFSVDAEVSFAGGILDGAAFLVASWDPAYTEGRVEISVNLAGIVKGGADIDFYAYGGGVWGFNGNVNLSFLGFITSETTLFAGSPGFFMETSVEFGIDLAIISGKLRIGGMFWYHATPDPSTYGAYTEIVASASFLKGLVAAKVGMEGALIKAEEFVFYSVGSFRLKLLWTTVFNGSMWVAASPSGVDGGKGRNSEYEGIMDQARNMADDMLREKEELEERLREARLAMLRLGDEQRAAAGSALLSTSGFAGPFVRWAFSELEVSKWDGDLPDLFSLIYGRIQGQEELRERRLELETKERELEAQIADLEALHNRVLSRMEDYEAVLIDPLPSVRELGRLGNPFGGFTEERVEGEEGRRVVTAGVRFNERRAARRRERFRGVIEDFAEYQNAFVEQAGLIDGRLAELDELLYETDNSLRDLVENYAVTYEEMSAYVTDFVQFQNRSERVASQSFNIIERQGDEEAVRSLLSSKALRYQPIVGFLDGDPEDLSRWNRDRLTLINGLLVAGGEEAHDPGDVLGEVAPGDTFVELGVELWWEIPRKGFRAVAEEAPVKAERAIDEFGEQSDEFRRSWTDATAAMDRVYDRKARLYDVLYEVYDQLAEYGSGMIGIGPFGHATGFSGAAGAGLAFRTEGVANAVRDTGVSPPEGVIEPKPGIVGPLSPLQFEVDDRGPGGIDIPGGFGGIAGGPTITSSAGTTFSAIELGPAVEGVELPETAVLDRSAAGVLSPSIPTAYVPVSSYFAFKRAETYPYLGAPRAVSVSGDAVSRAPGIAVLDVSVGAEHEIGVVEYAYTIRRLADEGPVGPGTDADSFSRLSGAVSQIHVDRPWFSLGARATLREIFFERLVPAGGPHTYGVAVRVRGAGGRAIVRRAQVQVEFFDGGIKVNRLDDADSSPPTTPRISVPQYVSRTDLVFASWEASDYESGIESYEYAVGSYDPDASGERAVPTDVLDWTAAATRTEANIRGLDLEHGMQYVVSVRATNGEGMTTVGSSDPIVVDLTPPEGLEVAEVSLRTVDGQPNSFSYAFDRAGDPESGVHIHELAVGTSDGEADLLDWREVETSEGYIVDLPVSHGTSVYVSVRAVNGAGAVTRARAPVSVSFDDATPPTNPNPRTYPRLFSGGTETLRLHWGRSRDPESGIVGVEYGLGTSPGAADVIPFTATKRSRSAYVVGETPVESGPGEEGVTGFDPPPPPDSAGRAVLEGLRLNHGEDYYGLVRVTNGAGMQAVYASEPLSIDETAPAGLSVDVPARIDTTERISFTVRARDPESGIRRFTYVIGLVGRLSSAPTDDDGARLVGWVSDGTFSGGVGSAPGSGGAAVAEGVELPPMEGPDPFETGDADIVYRSAAGVFPGAPPSEIDVDVSAVFDRGVLRRNGHYAMKVTVTNGVGLSAATVVYFGVEPGALQRWLQDLFGG